MTRQNGVTRYGHWVVNHPWIAMLLSLAVVFAAASGGRFLQFKTDYRVFFAEENPQLVAFEALEKTYTKNDNVMFIVTPKDGNVFTPNTLRTVQRLTKEAWQIPYSIRVDSISNFQHTEAENDDLSVSDLVPELGDLETGSIEKIKRLALAEPLLVNRLISPRGHVTGVNVTVHLPAKNQTEVPEIVSFSRDLAKKIEASDPNIEIRLSGMVLMDNAFAEASISDMQSLVLLSFVAMLITLGFLLKSVAGTIATFLVIMLSIFFAMGLGGYLGFPLTPPSATTPTIVLTVAIANAVHILVTLFQQMRKGHEKKLAIVESLRINMQPVFLASVTTAIGFSTMNFSDVPPFHHLGTMVALGVLASFFLAVLFLPALMCVLPIRVKAQPHTSASRSMAVLGEFVVRRRKTLLWFMLLLVVGLTAFLPRNELNDIFVNYFDTSVPFRRDADYFTANLGGLYLIDYSISAGTPGGISDPAFQTELESFAEWYRAQPETMHVSTFTDIMKRLNKNLHADDQSFYRVPDQRELAAQYLLLYEMSLPYGLDLNNQINVDKSATRFSVTLKTMSTNDLLALEARAQTWLKENTRLLQGATGSGTSMMFAHIGEKNIKSMLVGTTLALVLISLILVFAMRSIKIGAISLLPNLVPAAMGFGLWGIFVGEVGLSLSVVASMTLGIVVDDTIHFLSKYLRARRENNLSREAAVRYAFTSVGMAMFTTSVVLVVGFVILATSSFELNAGMGLLTAIIISFALMADFLMLPPLLMALDHHTYSENQSDKDDNDEDAMLDDDLLSPATT